MADVCEGGPVEHEGVLGDEESVDGAVRALVAGRAVAHGFGNFYALTALPDADTVVRVNRMKGRPAAQVGSVTCAPDRIDGLFDWSALPTSLPAERVRGLIEECYGLGPFRFRGPAATWVQEHLTAVQDGVRTVQLIAPGSRCRSNAFLRRAAEAAGTRLLFITSANRSRHATGADTEPAHWRAAGIRAEFGPADGVHVLRHNDEEAARRRHPLHDPMSTSVLSFHGDVRPEGQGRPVLVLERHGSLPRDQVAAVARRHGFDVALGPQAGMRLQARRYSPA